MVLIIKKDRLNELEKFALELNAPFFYSKFTLKGKEYCEIKTVSKVLASVINSQLIDEETKNLFHSL
jgi:hypothetical protein